MEEEEDDKKPKMRKRKKHHPKEDEESNEEVQELKEEIKEQNSKASNTWWLIFFGFVFIAVVAFFAIFFWVDRDDDDPFTNLNGDHLDDDDDEKGFMDIHSYTEKGYEYLLTLPARDVMDTSVGMCSDFYQYSCGRYNESYNMIINNLNSMDDFDASFEMTKIQNQQETKSPALKRFMSQCIDGLSQDGASNDRDVMIILKKVRELGAADQSSLLSIVHEFGLMPFVIYTCEDQAMNWIPSHWLKESAELTKAACSLLTFFHIVNSVDVCVNQVGVFYAELNQIDASNRAKTKGGEVRYSHEEIMRQFPLFLSDFVARSNMDHVLWSDITVKHLYSMVNHPNLQLWLQVLVVLDGAQYTPSIWTHDPLHSSISYQLLKRNAGKSGNFHYFRHGFGMDGLQLAHAASVPRARKRIFYSCAWLAGEMLPHELEVIRSSDNGAKEVTQQRFYTLKEFLKKSVRSSKVIHDTVKDWYITWIDHIRIQLGFPGSGIMLKESYLSFVDMVWDIRSQHMNNNFHLTWPASFHSTTCNAITLINEQLVMIPHCLYNAQWLGSNLDFLLYHEIMHLNYPEVMKQFGASPSEMDFLQSKLSCYGIEFSDNAARRKLDQEIFSYITAGTLSYQLCVAEKRCGTADDLKNFLISITQFFCNNNQGVVNPTYGNDRTRILQILKNMMNVQGISPFNNQYWNCYYANPCAYF